MKTSPGHTAAVRGTIERPVGSTDAVLLFDNKLGDSDLTGELLTIPETARFLKISISSVRRLQGRRQIPFFKVGGSVRFSKGDLLAYLDARRVESIG